MKTSHSLLLVILGLTFSASAADFEKTKADNWHHWRGPSATGVSTTAKPPTQWSEDKNIQWKIAIEGYGSAAPIIWGDKVFILTAINTGKVDPSLPRPEDQPLRLFGVKHPNTVYEFVVRCFDRKTGRKIWRKTATKLIPHEGTHGDNNFASASPPPMASGSIAGSVPPVCFVTISTAKSFGNANSAK